MTNIRLTWLFPMTSLQQVNVNCNKYFGCLCVCLICCLCVCLICCLIGWIFAHVCMCVVLVYLFKKSRLVSPVITMKGFVQLALVVKWTARRVSPNVSVCQGWSQRIKLLVVSVSFKTFLRSIKWNFRKKTYQ